MNADKMFRDYKTMKKELSVLASQLSHFTGISEEDFIESMSLSHPEGDERVQTSNLSDKTAKVAMNFRQVVKKQNDEWYNFLLNRYMELGDEINFFEAGIKQLGDKKADVLFELLDGDLTWDSIAQQYNISRALVGVYRKNAIIELDKRYEIREQQEIAYMLS